LEYSLENVLGVFVAFLETRWMEETMALFRFELFLRLLDCQDSFDFVVHENAQVRAVELSLRSLEEVILLRKALVDVGTEGEDARPEPFARADLD
jgi:hypothetical protein